MQYAHKLFEMADAFETGGEKWKFLIPPSSAIKTGMKAIPLSTFLLW